MNGLRRLRSFAFHSVTQHSNHPTPRLTPICLTRGVLLSCYHRSPSVLSPLPHSLRRSSPSSSSSSAPPTTSRPAVNSELTHSAISTSNQPNLPPPLSASLSSSLLLSSMLPVPLLSSLPWWLVVLLGYVSVSSALFYYPELLFPLRPKKVEVAFPVRFGAHRGGGGERPENTLAAFDHAVQCGCTLLELDVHLTKDGQVVVFHDATTTRTTGKAMVINDTAFDDLPFALSRMSAPPPFSPAGTMMSYPINASPTSPEWRHTYGAPLLRTVLQRYPQSVVNIDCKDDSDTLVDEVERVVKEERAEHRVIWGSVIPRVADRLHSHQPHSHLFFSRQDVMWLYIYYLTGLLPFMPLRAQYLEIPFIGSSMRSMFVSMLSPRVGPWLADKVGTALQWLGRRRPLFLHLKARGCPVVLWVVNTESDMREALDCGAEGIMTDFPSKMQTIFNIPSGSVPTSAGGASQERRER